MIFKLSDLKQGDTVTLKMIGADAEQSEGLQGKPQFKRLIMFDGKPMDCYFSNKQETDILMQHIGAGEEFTVTKGFDRGYPTYKFLKTGNLSEKGTKQVLGAITKATEVSEAKQQDRSASIRRAQCVNLAGQELTNKGIKVDDKTLLDRAKEIYEFPYTWAWVDKGISIKPEEFTELPF